MSSTPVAKRINRNARALCALAGFLTVLSVSLPSVEAAATSTITPLNVDVLLSTDTFETGFPGTVWNVADTDPYNGTDTWGNTTYRSAEGNSSVWSAAVGTSSDHNLTPVNDGFERGTLGSLYKDDSSSFSGTWDTSSLRAHAGNRSVWCAGSGGSGGLYPDSMNTIFYVDLDLTGWTSLNAEFWAWINVEEFWDYLYPVYYDGLWINLETFNNYSTVLSSIPWIFRSYDIPLTATRFGFKFTSDSNTHYQGAFLDELKLSGVGPLGNTLLNLYDDGANASLWRSVNVSAYPLSHFTYQYWTDLEAGADFLYAGYFAGSWTFNDSFTGSSGGWRTSSINLPSNATRIGFLFLAGATGHREGAYVDIVRLYGTVLSPTCSANVSGSSGYQVLDPFLFTSTVQQGWPPFNYSWSFGDGGTAFIRNPTHVFASPGNYTPSLMVRDSFGQTCTASTRTVEVLRDITNVTVAPLSLSVIEGDSGTLSGYDGQGAPYPLDWILAPPECGVLNATRGESVQFTTSTNAGAFLCTVTGSIGPVSLAMTIQVGHDTSTLSINPTSAFVVQGHSLVLSAADRNGHGLDFEWATTCGRLSVDLGPNTTFTAVTSAGVTCTVTARSGAAAVSADLNVIQDTSVITVTPGSANLTEGTDIAFSALDTYSNPFDAVWAVAPAGCGQFSVPVGAATRFRASNDSGGQTCTVSASFFADRKNVTVAVNHDVSHPSLAPTSANLVQGASQVFSVTDTFGHPLSLAWVLGPVTCGELSATTGVSVTANLSPSAGGSSCTLTATGPGINLGASISVLVGPPAAVRISVGALEVDAGASVVATAEIVDSANHTLTGLALDWSATCGDLSVASGQSRTFTLPDDAGAFPACTVTATSAGFSASATVRVRYAAPFTVAIEPAAPSLGGGASQVFTARVTDARGHLVPNASVAWSATCGALSAPEGASVTYTAPGDLGGTNCRVSAQFEGAPTQATSASVTVPMSALLPLGVIFPLVIGGALVFLFMKRRRGPKATDSPDEGPSEPGETPIAGAGLGGAAPGASAPAATAAPVIVSMAATSSEAKPATGVTAAPATAPAKPATTKPATAPAKPATSKPATAPAKPATSKPATAPAKPATTTPAKAATPPSGPPAQPPCPKCKAPVEVGWAACPECGLDLVWG